MEKVIFQVVVLILVTYTAHAQYVERNLFLNGTIFEDVTEGSGFDHQGKPRTAPRHRNRRPSLDRQDLGGVPGLFYRLDCQREGNADPSLTAGVHPPVGEQVLLQQDRRGSAYSQIERRAGESNP